MKFRKFGDTYVVNIESGEELMSCLQGLARNEKVVGARVQGIGSLEDVQLGFHLPDKERYKKQFFTGQFDLISLLGNISYDGAKDRAFVHVHAVIGDDEFRTFAGHLMGAKVLTSCELFVTIVGGEKIPSVPDETGGANPWQL